MAAITLRPSGCDDVYGIDVTAADINALVDLMVEHLTDLGHDVTVGEFVSTSEFAHTWDGDDEDELRRIMNDAWEYAVANCSQI